MSGTLLWFSTLRLWQQKGKFEANLAYTVRPCLKKTIYPSVFKLVLLLGGHHVMQ